MKFYVRFLKECPTAIPLIVILGLVLGFFFFGLKELAFLTSFFGVIFVLFAALIHIVVVDSVKRWPMLKWHQRLGRILSFTR